MMPLPNSVVTLSGHRRAPRADGLRRRDLIPVVVLAFACAAAVPLRAGAQVAGRPARVGVLAEALLRPLEIFGQKLRELGYVEGENLQLEYRFAEGRDERFPALAAELVARDVDVLVAWGTPAALAAKQATRAVPIVIGAMGDVLVTGIVSNLARPGGNITGFSSMNVELDEKRLELLRDLVGSLAQVGVLWNANNPINHVTVRRVRQVAESWGFSLVLVDVHRADDMDEALRRLVDARPDAVLVAPDQLFTTKRLEIVAAVAERRIPAVYPFREYAEAGGLLVYGADLGVLFQRAAVYVDKILKGAQPGDLPMQQATEFELIVNLKAARALGLTVPPQLLVRADEVIE
jgi:putative ABC transport system substrate-binding protein